VPRRRGVPTRHRSKDRSRVASRDPAGRAGRPAREVCLPFVLGEAGTPQPTQEGGRCGPQRPLGDVSVVDLGPHLR
jgi:hypothetical protein